MLEPAAPGSGPGPTPFHGAGPGPLSARSRSRRPLPFGPLPFGPLPFGPLPFGPLPFGPLPFARHRPCMPAPDPIAEARHTMEVCNACRYCEAFCAVFPAIERRRVFAAADLATLAHLCHGCRGCFYACQYAPPHPFGINVPRLLSELRLDSYARYAWPRPCAVLFRANGAAVALAMGLGAGLVVLLTAALRSPAILLGSHPVQPGAFYAVIPYTAMVWSAAAMFAFPILAVAVAVRAFWRDCGPAPRAPGALAAAVADTLTLRNLGGGGHGCNDRDETLLTTRRRLHHALVGGFGLCFAATCAAAIADRLGHAAPYPFWSAPVLFGTAGGVLMLFGAGGLVWLKFTGDQAPAARRLVGPDMAMLGLLILVPLSGLLLLALRATGAMGVALAAHLGFVLALFVMLPYSRMVHGAYRFVALLRDAREVGKGT